jgi:hypothetical protein
MNSSIIPETYTISGFIRQNAWGKMDKHIETVKSSLIIHCPWGHYLKDVTDYKSNPNGFNKKFAKSFIQFPTNSLILVGEAKNNKALLVRITTEPLTGIIDHYIIIRKQRTCGHSHTQASAICNECSESVVKVYLKENVTKEKLMDHMLDGFIAEPFYSIYRKVNVIGEINLDSILANDVRHYVHTCQNSIKATSITIPRHLVE